MPRTWFITGASRGLGRELTERLLDRGEYVAATLRDPSMLDDLKPVHGDRLWVARLDVADTDQIREVVSAARSALGGLDVVVSNAGYGVAGATEEVTDVQIEAIVATNLIGSLQLIRAALPVFRSQGGGRLIQLSSMGGLIGFPGMSMYHMTKWAIEGLIESLAKEVEVFGVRCTLVEPGMVRTTFAASMVRAPRSPEYDGTPARAIERTTDAQRRGDQAKVVDAIIDLAAMEQPPLRLLLGTDAYQVVTDALRVRLAGFERFRRVTESTDFDDFHPAH